MNGFEHVAHLADPGGRHMAEDVPIKMNHAALPLSVGQILRGTLHQASAGVGDDQLHAVEAAVDEVAQECRPPGLVLLGALADAQNLPKTLRIDGAGHQQRDIADFASPGPLHHDAIEIKVRMFAFDAPVPPRLDLGIDLLLRFDTVLGLTRVPHRASVMSSTLRTEIPARYISISASSTELSRRRYRSMIAVSKVWRRSFGTLRFTSPALVCSVRS